MIRRSALALFALFVFGVNNLPGRMIDTNTVYTETCSTVGACGEQLIVIDGDNPPTILDFLEPAFLLVELPPVLPGTSYAPAIAAQGSSIVRVSGGRMGADLGLSVIFAGDESTVAVTGGTISGNGGIVAVHQSRVNISGGMVSSNSDSAIVAALSLFDDASAEVSGGLLAARSALAAYTGGRGHLTITGGDFHGQITADDSGVIDMFAGSFDSQSTPSDRLFITTQGEGIINLYGGTLRDDINVITLDAIESGAINVFGTDLSLGPLEPDNVRRLTGTLADGSPINVRASGNIVLHEIELQPGDANRDLSFDTFDIIQVAQAAKYLTGQPATWGEGDWDGAPGGIPGNPPTGDGLFNQRDILAALQSGVYLTGRYVAVRPNGQQSDSQTSIIYDARTGQVAVDTPAGTELTSINIDSASGIFTGAAAQNLGGSFDNDSDNNIFKATFGSSFGSLSFGNVAQPGLAKDFLIADLSVVGSLAGGGDLGTVDLIYVPEPASFALAAILAASLVVAWRMKNGVLPQKRRAV